MEPGRRFIRVVEASDGVWLCRQGRQDLGRHGTSSDAIEQAMALAADVRPAEVMLHRSDGTVHSVASIE